MESWDVILWTSENTVDCVPSSWATNAKEKYLYPKNMKSSKILKLIKNCTPPSDKYSYFELDAKFKKTINNYSLAAKYLNKLEHTSNLEEDGDCEQVLVHEVPTYDSASSNHYEVPNVEIDEIPEDKFHAIEKLLKKLVIEVQGMKLIINELKEEQKAIEVAIATLISSNPKSDRDVQLKEWPVQMPFRSLEDMEFAENLLPEKDFILLNLLSLVGGQSLRHSITLMVRKLMSKDVAQLFSGQGRKGKKNFCQSKFFPIIAEAARFRDKTATDTIIKQYISLALASVKDWDGGYCRRTNAMNSEQNIQTNEEDKT